MPKDLPKTAKDLPRDLPGPTKMQILGRFEDPFVAGSGSNIKQQSAISMTYSKKTLTTNTPRANRQLNKPIKE